MRKLIFLGVLALMVLGCKSKSATPTTLNRNSQVELKGNWVITSVTYPNSEYIKVNSFKIADSQCFVGSTWRFISNNNKGEMALTKADCPAFSSPITWFMNRENQFVLKILDAGIKAKKIREGYILRVGNQTDKEFQFIDKVYIEGKVIDVVYQFQKV